MSAFAGSAFQNSAFQVDVLVIGGAGDNQVRGGGIFKPTGLAPRKKLSKKQVESVSILENRTEEARQVGIELAASLALELRGKIPRIALDSLQGFEQGFPLEPHKQKRNYDDDMIAILLLAASS